MFPYQHRERLALVWTIIRNSDVAEYFRFDADLRTDSANHAFELCCIITGFEELVNRTGSVYPVRGSVPGRAGIC